MRKRDSLNIAIIGLGSMGKRRLRILKKVYPDYTLFGVDSRDDRRLEAAERHSIECFPSITDLLNEHEVTCAFVCTSPISHYPIIMDCLHNNLNVFTEINLISDGYEEMIDLAKEKKKTVFLSSTPIYRSEMRAIENCVDINKKYGYIYHVGQYLPDWHPWEKYGDFFISNPRTGGCREILSIELPWITRTFGSIVDIHSFSCKLSKLNINYDDFCTLQILHKNGTVGTIVADVVSRKASRHLEIVDERTYIEWNGTPSSLVMKNIENDCLEKLDSSKYSNVDGYSEFINEEAYVNEINEFFKVLGGKESEYGLEDDIKTLEWIDKI